MDIIDIRVLDIMVAPTIMDQDTTVVGDSVEVGFIVARDIIGVDIVVEPVEAIVVEPVEAIVVEPVEAIVVEPVEAIAEQQDVVATVEHVGPVEGPVEGPVGAVVVAVEGDKRIQ